MLRKLSAFLVLLFAATLLPGQTPPAGKLSLQGVAPQDTLAVFTTLSATGQTPAISLVGNPLKPGGTNPGIVSLYTPKTIAVQATITGAPATCTYTVYGTLKTPVEAPVYPTDYAAISTAQTCTSSGIVFLTNVPVAQVVVNLSALTGGTSPTVSLRVLGVH